VIVISLLETQSCLVRLAAIVAAIPVIPGVAVEYFQSQLMAFIEAHETQATLRSFVIGFYPTNRAFPQIVQTVSGWLGAP
jgi:hypothetical protein